MSAYNTCTRLIQRPRLDTELSTAAPLVLLQAPSGFGKTTAINLWLEKQDLEVCWLMLEKNYDNRALFWRLMIEQLSVVLPELQLDRYFDFSNEMALVAFPQILKRLLAASDLAANTAVIVFDDTHKIEHVDTVTALAQCIAVCSNFFKVIVAGQHSDNFSRIKNYSKGHYKELDANTLKLTALETQAWLSAETEQSTSLTEAERICEETGGWPTALTLIRLLEDPQSESDSTLNQTISTVCYPSLDIAFDAIWINLADSVQNLLLAASIFTRFSPAILEATLQDSIDSAFYEVRTLHLFIRSDLQQIDEYAFHDLFRDYLQLRFSRLPKQQQHVYFERAATWYLEQQLYDQALTFAIKAQAWPLVADALLSSIDVRLADGSYRDIYEQLSKIPSDIVYQDPVLLITLAWTNPDAQKFERSFGLLEQANKLLENVDHNTEKHRRLKCMSLTLMGFLCFWHDKLLDGIRYSQTALKLSNQSNKFLQARILNTLGQCYFHIGWLEKAEIILRQSRALALEQRRLYDLAVGIAYLLESMRLQGKSDAALEIYELTVQQIFDEQLQHNPMFLWVRNPIVAIYMEQAQFKKVEELLAETAAQLESTPVNVTFLSFYLMKTAFAISERSWKEAKESIDTWEKLLQQIPTRFGIGKSTPAGYRALVNLRSGQSIKAKQWAQENKELPKQTDFKSEDDRLVLARVYLREKPKQAKAILDLIRRKAASNNRQLTLMLTYAIEAELYWYHGSKLAAESLFQEALEIVLKSNYKVSLLVEGSYTLELCKHFYEELPERFHPYQKQLAELVSLAETMYGPQLTSKPLTPTEQTVLTLVAKGLSDKAIAEKLLVSVGTTKTHTRNIYRKLGVKNRQEAVHEADRLGLWL